MYCRVCSTETIEILSLGEQYLSDFRTDGGLPSKYPLDLQYCPHCTLVQLGMTVDPKELYHENYSFKSGINNTIKDDLADIVVDARASINYFWQNDVVLDIGSNDGTLLSNYPEDWFYRVGIDPISHIFGDEPKQHANVIIDDFFSLEKFFEATSGRKAKLITMISCFYDIDDPNAFLREVKGALLGDGVFIIQMNYLGTMVLGNTYDNISHEHVAYYSLRSLEYLLNRHGLKIFKIKLNDINGGSFRVFISHQTREDDGSISLFKAFEKNFRLDDPYTYNLFDKRVRWAAAELYDTIHDLNEEGKTVGVLGASTRGNTILQYTELDNNMIKFAIDRNPTKVGKRIASTGIPIISEEDALKQKADALLILPYFFEKEIRARSKDFLNPGGQFVIPLPNVKLYG